MERRSFLQAAAIAPLAAAPAPHEEEAYVILAYEDQEFLRPWGLDQVRGVLADAREQGVPHEVVASPIEITEMKMFCRWHGSRELDTLQLFDPATAQTTGFVGSFLAGPLLRCDLDAPEGLLRVYDRQGKLLAFRFSCSIAGYNYDIQGEHQNLVLCVDTPNASFTVAAGRNVNGKPAYQFLGREPPPALRETVLRAVSQYRGIGQKMNRANFWIPQG